MRLAKGTGRNTGQTNGISMSQTISPSGIQQHPPSREFATIQQKERRAKFSPKQTIKNALAESQGDPVSAYMNLLSQNKDKHIKINRKKKPKK